MSEHRRCRGFSLYVEFDGIEVRRILQNICQESSVRTNNPPFAKSEAIRFLLASEWTARWVVMLLQVDRFPNAEVACLVCLDLYKDTMWQ